LQKKIRQYKSVSYIMNIDDNAVLTLNYSEHILIELPQPVYVLSHTHPGGNPSGPT